MLVRQLADWAVGARQMHAVIRLPLHGLEEQVRQHIKHACMHACTHSHTSHTYTLMRSDTLRMQPTSHLLLFVAQRGVIPLQAVQHVNQM